MSVCWVPHTQTVTGIVRHQLNTAQYYIGGLSTVHVNEECVRFNLFFGAMSALESSWLLTQDCTKCRNTPINGLCAVFSGGHRDGRNADCWS